MAISGWPDCSPAEFFAALINVIDAIEAGVTVIEQALEERGLTYGEYLKIVADATSLKNRRTLKAETATRRGVRRLFLADFAADHIAAMLELDPTEVEEHLRAQGMKEAGRQIVALHRKGLTPWQIATELKISRPSVYAALEVMGLEPHRERTFLPVTTRNRIVALYREGKTYAEIQAELNVQHHQVTNSLRAAHKRGLCPEYGSRKA